MDIPISYQTNILAQILIFTMRSEGSTFQTQFKLRELQKKKQEKCKAEDSPRINHATHISAARIRLQKDIESLQLPPFAKLNIVRDPTDNSKESPLLELRLSPDEGYYKGGTITFRLNFNENYPIEPPSVSCLNTIFHPNIDTQGKICLNILREDWSPALDLQSVVIGLSFLFLEVTAKDPLNEFAASVLSKDESTFSELVKNSMAGAYINGEKYDYIL